MSGAARDAVLLLSAGHSGSTLLDLLLGSHSRGASLGELAFWGRRLRARRAGEVEGLCGICAGTCPFWDGRVSTAQLARLFRGDGQRNLWLRRLYVHFGPLLGQPYDLLLDAAGADFVVDSTGATWWVRRQIRPNPYRRRHGLRLLYLFRDGRAVANSILRKYPDTDVRSFARAWVRTSRQREAIYRRFPGPKTRVGYEPLTRRPAAELARLCDWLGQPNEPAMLEYWRHDHHPVEGNAGTRSLILRYRREGWEERLATGETDTDHYRRLGLDIRPDLRWHDELPEAARRVFESVAGGLNDELAERAREAA